MKYDVMLSDLVAFVAGFIGLLAVGVSADNLYFAYQSGQIENAIPMAGVLTFVLLLSLMFLTRGLYDRMIWSANGLFRRPFFGLIWGVWLATASYILTMIGPQDLWGVSNWVPLEVLPLGLAVFFLVFLLAFIFPGIVFWQFGGYRALLYELRQKKGVEKSGLTNFLYMVLILVAFAYLFMPTFVPVGVSYDFWKQSEPWLLPTAGGIFLLLLPAVWSSRLENPQGQVVSTWHHKVVLFLILMPASYGVACASYWRFVPAAYNSFGTTEQAEVAYVVESTTSSRVCRNGVRLYYPGQTDSSFEICSLDRGLHARLSPGLTIYAKGAKSEYGHTIEDIRIPLL